MADAGSRTSALDGTTTRVPRAHRAARRDRTPQQRLLLVVVVVVLLGAYLLLAVASTGRVTRKTTVGGVDIGGLSADAAVDRLERDLAPRLDRPVTVRLAGSTLDLVPSRSGLRLDAAETVASVSGRSLRPDRLWHALTGGEAIEPVVALDPARFGEATAALADKAHLEPRDGSLTFAHGKAVAHAASEGSSLDPALAGSSLASVLAADGLRTADPVDLPLAATRADIDGDDVAAALRDFGDVAMSAPLTLRAGSKTLQVTPARFSAALSMRPVNGHLQPVLDEDRLRAAVGADLAALESRPRKASFRIVGGKPEVVAARAGGVADSRARFEGVLDALVHPAGPGRVATARLAAVQPSFTTAAARSLGITEKVSTYTTYYPHAAYRNINIGRAAELLDGTLVRPGAVFSLNKTLGERTAARGFVKGIVITGGRYRESLGGGVSQVSTTTYNAAFFAGLQDVEHRAHGFSIDRYPVGREATLDWGTLDLKFRNNTPTGLFITASVRRSTTGTDGAITVTMWGTRYWTVKSTSSHRYNVRRGENITDSGSDCVPQAGNDGFDIDITRRIYRASKLVHTETYTTHYNAENVVTCTG